MSKTTHYELNTPIGSEILSVMTGLNPNFTTIDGVMYDNETRSNQALNKANVNEQNIATTLGRVTTAEGDIDTLESGLETANTNISGLISRVDTAESNIVASNNRIQENSNAISQINSDIEAQTNEFSVLRFFYGAGGSVEVPILLPSHNSTMLIISGNRLAPFMIDENGNITSPTNSDITVTYSNGKLNISGGGVWYTFSLILCSWKVK